MTRKVWRRLIAVGAAIASTLAISGISSATTQPAASGVTITLHPDSEGNQLVPNMVGLSTEVDQLYLGGIGLPHLADYMRTLNPHGVLRIGGNSADNSFWTSTGETAPSWASGTVTPASLTTLNNVLKASGWSTLLTVNLRHKDPARAADEVRYAHKILGSSLKAIAIGNESDGFYLEDTAGFFRDFEDNVKAIKKAVPSVKISGPDAAYYPRVFPDFVNNELGLGHPDIDMLSNHHAGIQIDPCPSSIVPSPEQMLGLAVDQKSAQAATDTVSAAKQLGVQPIFSETNSIDCGGAPGTSNTFVSSLWAMNYGLLLAQKGIVEVNFHSGFLHDCGQYGTVCANESGTELTAHPVFYGMLAVEQLGTGNFIDMDNPDTTNIRAYAIRNGNRLNVALIDVRTDSTSAPTTVTLNLGATYKHAQQTQLASPSGVSATSGVTLGGHQIATDGSFPAPTYTPVTTQNQSLSVTLNPGSATILQLN